MPRKSEPTIEISVSDHVYVPKHEILSKADGKGILKKYVSKPNQLPHILVSDPIAKELGAKAGDILKITRVSETAGTAPYYRLVVES